MKCIKLLIDEDNMICKTEDGKDKFTEETFHINGMVVIQNW